MSSATNALSVQQIKFECLAYIKEFGLDAGAWSSGICAAPEAALAAHGVDQARDIWLWKPALTPVAARSVIQFLEGRIGVRVPQVPAVAEGAFVFLYRKRGVA